MASSAPKPKKTPPKKKASPAKKAPARKRKNDDDVPDNTLVSLSSTRHVTKWKQFVDVREYYISADTRKWAPTKKGFAMSAMQWKRLKKVYDDGHLEDVVDNEVDE